MFLGVRNRLVVVQNIYNKDIAQFKGIRADFGRILGEFLADFKKMKLFVIGRHGTLNLCFMVENLLN